MEYKLDSMVGHCPTKRVMLCVVAVADILAHMTEFFNMLIKISFGGVSVFLSQRYFEVVSSERSYNQSMKVLVSHFMESEALSNASGSTRIISPQTHHSLFSNARVLLDVSNR